MPSSRARSRAACTEARARRPDDAGCTVSFSFDMHPKAAMRLAFPLLRNTIAAQVKANIGRLPSALTEAGEI